MKCGTVFLVLVLTALGAMTPRAQAQTAADAYWWHYRLSQSQRDAAVLRTAQSFADNAFVGMSCKVWVQQAVVYPGSFRVVWLPLNSGFDWLWQWSADVETVAVDNWNSVNWPPGEIIQAQVRTVSGGLSPHTMIIVSANSAGVNVIECNWRNDGRVRRRYVSWADLQRQIVHYTLYRVK